MQTGHANIWQEIYLLGGLLARRNHRQRLTLYPTTAGKILEFPITDTQQYAGVIQSLVTDVIGHENHVEIGAKPQQSLWYIHQPTPKHKEKADDIWNWIAHTAKKEGKKDLADSAQHVAFALRTSTLRLRDCAREYAWQNEYAVTENVIPEGRFSNIKMFDLDMALHSLLADMGTARDYLGHFISRYIVCEAKPVDSMARLSSRAKNGEIQIPNSEAKKLIESIIVICDRKHPDGWMARLSEFRNVIIHRAPLESLSESPYLHAKTIETANVSLFQIYFGVPRDPLMPDGQYVDALGHFRQLLLKLLDFAQVVAAASGITPTMPIISPQR